MSLEFLIRPSKFFDAIKRLGSKKPIAKKLSSKQWAAMPTQIRERAYFTANVESMKFLNRSKKMMQDYLAGARETVTTPDGRRVSALKKTSRKDFIFEMQKLAKQTGLGEIMPPGEDLSRDLITRTKDIASETRLKLIFDTQTQQAQSYGYYKQGQDPAILDAYPAQRFIRAEQRKVPRPLHKSNRNEVRRKDDMEFWLRMNDQSIGGFGVPFGPWGFNSGMDVEDVRRDEAIRMGLIDKNEQVLPPDDTFNKGLKAAADVEPEFLKKFLDKLDKNAYTDGEFVEMIEKISNVKEPAPAKKVPKKVIEPDPILPSPEKAYSDSRKIVLKEIKKIEKQNKESTKALEIAAKEQAKAKEDFENYFGLLNYRERIKEQGKVHADQMLELRWGNKRAKQVQKLDKKYKNLNNKELIALEVEINSKETEKTLKVRNIIKEQREKYEEGKQTILNKAVYASKPNNYKPEVFNTVRKPKKILPEWEKGVNAFNKITGDMPENPFDSDIGKKTKKAKTISNKITLTRGERAFSAQQSGIFLNKYNNAATVVHELGHQIEDSNPWAKKMVNEWMDERLEKGRIALVEKLKTETDETKRETIKKSLKNKYALRQLKKIVPNSKYKADEKAYEDDFLSPYVGKVYQRGSTEIISMGLEWMYKNPVGFYEKDPDHFDLILRILKGVPNIEVTLPPSGAWNLKAA